MAAPAVRSVPALATRRTEVKRFRLNAGAIFIFIRVGFCGLINLRRVDYEIVIIESSFFFAIFLLGRLSWNEPERGEELGAGFHCSPGAVSTQVGYKSSRSPLHRAAAIHFIHFNEAAVISRGRAIITEL
jgi:hypothetical protein